MQSKYIVYLIEVLVALAIAAWIIMTFQPTKQRVLLRRNNEMILMEEFYGGGQR